MHYTAVPKLQALTHVGNAALEVGSNASNPGNSICVCIHVSLFQSCQAGSLMWMAEKPQTMGSD